jgi:hypothetical protein
VCLSIKFQRVGWIKKLLKLSFIWGIGLKYKTFFKPIVFFKSLRTWPFFTLLHYPRYQHVEGMERIWVLGLVLTQEISEDLDFGLNIIESYINLVCKVWYLVDNQPYFQYLPNIGSYLYSIRHKCGRDLTSIIRQKIPPTLS